MKEFKLQAVVTVRKDTYTGVGPNGQPEYSRGEEEVIRNLVTDAGRVALHTLMYGTAAQKAGLSLGSGFNYMAISGDATAPDAGDTSLAGELSSDGLSRASVTPTLPTGSEVLTSLNYEFTYTGTAPQSVQKAALFDAASSGNMAHEIAFSLRTLAQNDTLTLTFNITMS
jgi:hypothetical protein